MSPTPRRPSLAHSWDFSMGEVRGGSPCVFAPLEESLPRPPFPFSDLGCARVSVTEFPPSQGKACSQPAAQGPGAQSPLAVGLEEGVAGSRGCCSHWQPLGLGVLSSVPEGQVGTHRVGAHRGLGEGRRHWSCRMRNGYPERQSPQKRRGTDPGSQPAARPEASAAAAAPGP